MSTSDGTRPLAESSKRFGRRLLAMVGSRGELLELEMEEERRHLLWAGALALGASILALLSGLALTAAIVILYWDAHPVAVLLSLSALYACGAIFLGRKVADMHREWKVFPATLDQLRKDGECLEKPPPLNSLQARKQLLIIECEVHREMLLQDCKEFSGSLHGLVEKAETIIKAASSAAGAVSAISSVWPKKDPSSNGKSSFFKTMLAGLRMGTSLWLALKKNRE